HETHCRADDWRHLHLVCSRIGRLSGDLRNLEMAFRSETRAGGSASGAGRAVMKTMVGVLTLLLGLSSGVGAQQSKTYVGVITDTMCVDDHKPMKVAPDAKCVRDCVGDARTYKYALTE